MSEPFYVKHIEVLPIKSLKRWKNNPRNNANAVEPLRQSIRTYGMLVPLLINKKNEIIAGDTRVQAAELEGMTKVPCVRAENLTPIQQTMFNIADNKLHELATWDQDRLRDILDNMQDKLPKFDPTLVGFQKAEIDLIFNGWQSNAQRMGDIKSSDDRAPGKIIVECLAEDEESLRVALEGFVAEKFKEVVIR